MFSKNKEPGKPKRRPRYRKGNVAFNAGVRALSYTGIIAIEVLIVGILSATNKITVDAYGLTIRLAYAEAVLSVVFGLLSAMASEQATHAKNDPRPECQARFKRLRAAAFALIVVPVLFLAQALTWPIQNSRHETYVSGTVIAADRKTTADDTMRGTDEYADALKRLSKWEAKPNSPEIDPVMLALASIIYVLASIVPGMLMRPAAETPAETRERLRQETIAKGRATREANIQAEHARQLELLKQQEAIAKANGKGRGFLHSVKSA